MRGALIVVFIFVVIALGLIISLNKPIKKNSVINLSPTKVMINSKKISLLEVEKHNTADSCWLAIEGKVYDFSPYIAGKKHPGRGAIIQGCGKDATSLYNTRPMGSKTPHSDRAKRLLSQYYIGDLAD